MIHSDNGAEIKNQCLEAFLQDKGITHTFFYEFRWTCKVQGYKDGKLFKNLLNLQKKLVKRAFPIDYNEWFLTWMIAGIIQMIYLLAENSKEDKKQRGFCNDG